jgi:predicted acylesterase/phospholipase RssA
MKSILRLASIALLTSQIDAKCVALALSSGDEDSAYQAGALKGIINSTKLTPADYAYDSVSGISDGALNAVILANYQKGQEKEAVDRMVKFWTDATHSTLYKDWVGGIARGLLYEGGLYNSDPLKAFLKQQFSDFSAKRGLNIGIVNVNDGAYKDFNQDTINSSNLQDVLFASMSVPGFFPPAEVLGSTWFDGSAVWDIDIFAAIN